MSSLRLVWVLGMNSFVEWFGKIPQKVLLETGSSSDKIFANQNVNLKLCLMMLLNSGRIFEIDHDFCDFVRKITIGVL